MNVVRVVKFENNVFPICESGDLLELLVPRSLIKEKGSGNGKKIFVKFLNDRKAEFNCSIKQSDDKKISILVDEFYQQSQKIITVTADLKLGTAWNYVDEAFTGFPSDHDARENLSVIRKLPKSNTAYIYITEKVLEDEDLSDYYDAIVFNVQKIDWCAEKIIVKVKPSINAYLYSQHKKKAEKGRASFKDNSKNKDDALSLIRMAVERRATDIHVNYFEDSPGEVKFRIDSRLVHYNYFASESTLAMLRSIYNSFGRSVSGLGFSPETQQDTDAVLSLEVAGVTKDLTLRWQSIPVDAGLSVRLRVLDNDPSKINKMQFKDMGYEDQHIVMIENAISSKQGFILTTGTTSSGKSTTNLKMMTVMRDAHPEWAFNTVEDPIEYRIPGISQHQVSSGSTKKAGTESEKKKEEFNILLSGLMRFDPDVIGIGEVRDPSSAEIVRDFVNTGHKIFSTLHADSALYTYDRLADVGLDRVTLCRPDFFSLIIYQSLLPKTCTHCAVPFEEAKISDSYRLSISKIFHGETKDVRFHNPAGCDQCNSGIKGMTLCAELLMPDETISELIRIQNYSDARQYWLNEMPPLSIEAKYHGHTIEEHMLWKIKSGLICPELAKSEKVNIEILCRNVYPYLKSGYKFSDGKIKAVANQ
jgi:type II secretory ATPase GspE/PulE/Tfp pilus assembly ATPase PilB-like protein